MERNVCTIDGCDRPIKVKKWGYCSIHYGRQMHHGDPLYEAVATGRPASGRYPVRDLTCRVCGAPFRGRHGRRCRPCRLAAESKTCECGASIGPRSAQCRSCRGKANSGPANPRWNGGRFVGADGYAMVYAPDHPRRQGIYMPEHHLVMEAMLGRLLVDGENVHHRNGRKGDNSPGNLELWLVGQPAGQRVADLLVWARELIATYEPIEAILADPMPVS